MSMALKYGMKKRQGKPKRDANETGVHKSGSGGMHSSAAGDLARVGKSLKDKGERARVYGEKEAGEGATEASKKLHREKLAELKSDKQDRTNLADGGEVKPIVDPDKSKEMADAMKKAFRFARGGEVGCAMCEGGRCMEHGGMVDRIMAKRQPDLADFKPNEFDELELDPAPSPPHSGDDYGDDLGNEALHENDRDLISRIMRSRAKKDRLPRPA